ncbi:AzlD domain-containing protein [Acidimicrobiia bacterium EGI L10123]|uniref:AzlD domain-containing protein n=1 Tax=Salinilacustrithrix flava TaxID=2957203 RepID=UPI003D7C32A3|nr:AzlD domain-containing protein [Acidimicrobiia bacterium EGI L10123]
MSTSVVVIIGLGLGTYALKAAGPLLLGGRRLPTAVERIAQLLPAALLASLVVVSTVAGDRALVVDARLAGVVAGGVALRLRAPFIVVVAVAVAVTGVVRALLG